MCGCEFVQKKTTLYRRFLVIRGFKTPDFHSKRSTLFKDFFEIWQRSIFACFVDLEKHILAWFLKINFGGFCKNMAFTANFRLSFYPSTANRMLCYEQSKPFHGLVSGKGTLCLHSFS